MEITINLKTVSTIVAIVAVIIGIIEGLNVFSLSGLVPDFVFYGYLAIIIAILGLLGVYISKMDIRIAAIQYIILGLGLFIAIGYYGVIGCVIFIVAGVLAIAEYVQTKEEVTPDKKLFLIPVLTIVIIVLFLLASAGLGVLDSMAASDSVSFSGLSAAISNDYGVTSGDLTGTLNVDKDFDYLEVKVRFYNSNNLVRKFTINYAKHFMIITNENGIRKVLYNGIVYVNPKVIFLDNSHIKIDKSNLV